MGMPTRVGVPIVALLFLVLVGGDLSSQTLEVTVVSMDSGAPIAGAVVNAADSTGQVVATEVTTRLGSARLNVPVAGTWHMRITHYGFRPHETRTAVSSDELTRDTVALELEPLPVEGLLIDLRSRCPTESRDPDVQTLWQAAHTILTAAADSTDRGPRARFQYRVAERHWKAWERLPNLERARGQNRWNQTVDTVWVRGLVPIQEPAPARVLSDGFVLASFPHVENSTEYEYYLPGPRTLTSTAFLQTHCLASAGEREGRSGLRFFPSDGSTVDHDVEGTIWIPSAKDQPLEIEFDYTTLPHEANLWGWSDGSNANPRPVTLGGRTGGDIHLRYVPEIGWVISHFSVRWPLLDRRSILVEGHSRPVWWLEAIMEREARLETLQLEQPGPPGRSHR